MKDEATLGFKLFFLGIVLGTILMASNSFVLKKENEELRVEKKQTGTSINRTRLQTS